ncbi:hypothetical protein N5079_10030 [Planotetraspora sp. A-T 1434]|uniref:hypothetical protein n=1 Tax=Planotetraspora sp. A-T 1434 TaxID=2979219 RepID=UPI0021C07952|nr:hypothetical protein [Planotetraspora sp. A-T 1434]MCT9930553.1 hypothetical protein [Planotetraspora sp. A-T 1434]
MSLIVVLLPLLGFALIGWSMVWLIVVHVSRPPEERGRGTRSALLMFGAGCLMIALLLVLYVNPRIVPWW